MTAFDTALSRGELDLGEFAQPFDSAEALAAYILDEENCSAPYIEARRMIYEARRKIYVGLAISNYYVLAQLDCVVSACRSTDWNTRIRFAMDIVGCGVAWIKDMEDLAASEQDDGDDFEGFDDFEFGGDDLGDIDPFGSLPGVR